MKILVRKAKMQRRVATTPNDSGSEIEKEPSPTYEEAAKSFERNATRIQNEESQTTIKQKEDQKKEANKRPLSDSSITRPLIQPQKKTNFVTDKELSENYLNPTQKLTAVAARKIKT